MAYMTWSEAISVGSQSIDAEHREMMDVINQLHVSLVASDPEDKLMKIFQRLTDCTMEHFRSEEKHFVGTDYPRATIHARKHEHLVLILGCFHTGFDTTGKRVSFEEQLDFLRDWLLDHIATEDRRLGDYLNLQERSRSSSIEPAS